MIAVIRATENKRDNPAIRLQNHRKEAFASCQLRKPVVFPQTVKEIKESAFSENHSLREVTFPASLEILGDYSYKGCTALKR